MFVGFCSTLVFVGFNGLIISVVWLSMKYEIFMFGC